MEKQEKTTGCLYLVSTPIGNLEDITLRALRILKEVDLIAAEDTRHTRQLLAHFDIHTPLTSFHAFNEHAKCSDILERVHNGESVAMVSDAGTPGIADPGFFAVREAVRSAVPVVVIPGASALTFAAAASGLPIDKLAFYAFPPVKSGRRRKFFERMAAEDKTVFLYESPHRIAKALTEVAEICGPDRKIAVIREATKLHEEVLRGTVQTILAETADRSWKGEFVVAVAPEEKNSNDEHGADGDDD